MFTESDFGVEVNLSLPAVAPLEIPKILRAFSGIAIPRTIFDGRAGYESADETGLVLRGMLNPLIVEPVVTDQETDEVALAVTTRTIFPHEPRGSRRWQAAGRAINNVLRAHYNTGVIDLGPRLVRGTDQSDDFRSGIIPEALPAVAVIMYNARDRILGFGIDGANLLLDAAANLFLEGYQTPTTVVGEG